MTTTIIGDTHSYDSWRSAQTTNYAIIVRDGTVLRYYYQWDIPIHRAHICTILLQNRHFVFYIFAKSVKCNTQRSRTMVHYNFSNN